MKTDSSSRPQPQVMLNGQTLTIEGASIDAEFRHLPLHQVRLDLSNPRIQYLLKQNSKNGKLDQDELTKLILEIHGVPALFAHIRDNLGLIEPIYVRPDGRVIEGNCRTAAYMRLLSIDLKKGIKNSHWQAIPAFVVPSITERQVAVLQGQVHVAGKNKWRAYEKAGHLHSMRMTLKMDDKAISQVLGIPEGEVARDIKAYETITKQLLPKMKGANVLEKWSIFDEFFKRKDLEDYRSKSANVTEFVSLVRRGRLNHGADVRKLAGILNHKGAMKVLKTQGVDQALSIVGQKDPTADSRSFRQLKKTATLLRKFPRKDLDRLRAAGEPQQILQELIAAARTVAKFAGLRLS
jgi:hypothetical protein